jgi:hypothetical protein
LPTNDFPSLIVEDTGIGMTNEDVMTVYKSYGKSTKSNSNKMIGALGLGGKTPLAYTQQFTLATAKDGTLNQYIIYKDGEGIPNVTLVHSEASSKTGTTVEVLIKEEDISKFHNAAIKTFLFFDKMPIIKRGEYEFYQKIINTFGTSYSKWTIETAKTIFDEARKMIRDDDFITSTMGSESGNAHYLIRKIAESYNSSFGVIMGQIYYDVNNKQLFDTEKYERISETALNFPVIGNSSSFKKIMHVPLGSISIQPSRESLNYNKNTITYLQQKFYSHYNDWQTSLQNACDTPQKYLKNFDKIENAKMISHDCFDFVTLNKELSFANKLYKETVNYTFKNLLKNPFVYQIRSKKRSWEMYNLHSQLKDYCNTTAKELFKEMVFNKSLNRVFVIDDKTFIDKMNSFYEKATIKSKSWGIIPVGIKNKIELMKSFSLNEKLLCVTTDSVDIIKKLFPNMTFEYFSKLIIPKTATARRASGPRDTVAKCWDFKNGKYVNDDVFNLIGKEAVTYECFEGIPGTNGWWFTPDFAKL